ncbi:MAG: hypothetical protein M3P44_07155 [Actinomycetota bacterium]|nr:hypothetical protein [Actinomycetota bacterium]
MNGDNRSATRAAQPAPEPQGLAPTALSIDADEDSVEHAPRLGAVLGASIRA